MGSEKERDSIELKSFSPEETIRLGRRMGKLLRTGDIVLLKGELGTGKTLFTGGIAGGLGIEENINSPSYTLIKEYEGAVPLFHMDFYRLDDRVELYNIGFEEYLSREGVVVIEWPELAADLLPPDRITVEFTVLDKSGRLLRICGDNRIREGMHNNADTGD